MRIELSVPNGSPVSPGASGTPPGCTSSSTLKNASGPVASTHAINGAHSLNPRKRLEANCKGRLGLFHFEKCIVSTLKKKHADCLQAVNDSLHCLCTCNSDDCECLLNALKDGSLTGKRHSSQDIMDLKGTKFFRDRCSESLCKQMP